ncbi:MAG: methionine--tRNA ligase, partial [Rhizobacter sp.]|nr:methionine--tRNA ligase [Chlorobiales bacterium]
MPYANGELHLGHFAGTFLPADIYVRYKRLRGEDIIHIGGSDEHGVPITIRAEKEGITPQAVVDRYHALHVEALNKAHIALDNYSRTSLPVHHETTQEFFLDMEAKGIFVKKTEQQFYDAEAKMFLSDRYITGTCPVCGNPEANGDQCENCGTYLSPTELINPKSKLTGATPILRETLHWYFPLGRYQKQLEAFIDAKEKSGEWRQNVINYSRTWLKQGLADRAITRDLSWGVKVPLHTDEAKGKVIYVWYDAVLGYISSTKEWATKLGEREKWRQYWLAADTRLIHFIGKDNVVFHALMFPAMLMAKNETGNADESSGEAASETQSKYILPDNVPASEFMNIEGKKFSKSRGYAIYMLDFLSKFPADTLRYTIAMNYPESRDTDFSWKDFQNRVNGELADTLGNFVKRVVDFTYARFDGIVPDADTVLLQGEREQTLESEVAAKVKIISEAYETFSIRTGVFETMQVAGLANKYFNDEAPWKSIKENPEQCKKTIFVALNLCSRIAMLFYPVIPETAQKIFRMIGVDAKSVRWDDAST